METFTTLSFCFLEGFFPVRFHLGSGINGNQLPRGGLNCHRVIGPLSSRKWN